jgi:hypothetical protein
MTNQTEQGCGARQNKSSNIANTSSFLTPTPGAAGESAPPFLGNRQAYRRQTRDRGPWGPTRAAARVWARTGDVARSAPAHARPPRGPVTPRHSPHTRSATPRAATTPQAGETHPTVIEPWTSVIGNVTGPIHCGRPSDAKRSRSHGGPLNGEGGEDTTPPSPQVSMAVTHDTSGLDDERRAGGVGGVADGGAGSSPRAQSKNRPVAGNARKTMCLSGYEITRVSFPPWVGATRARWVYERGGVGRRMGPRPNRLDDPPAPLPPTPLAPSLVREAWELFDSSQSTARAYSELSALAVEQVLTRLPGGRKPPANPRNGPLQTAILPTRRATIARRDGGRPSVWSNTRPALMESVDCWPLVSNSIQTFGGLPTPVPFPPRGVIGASVTTSWTAHVPAPAHPRGCGLDDQARKASRRNSDEANGCVAR